MKKLFLFLGILLLSVNLYALKGDVRVGVYGVSAFQAYTSVYDDTQTMVNAGYIADVEESTGALGIDANLALGQKGMFDWYGKAIIVPGMSYKASFLLTGLDTPYIEIKSDLLALYAGLGGRLQFNPFPKGIFYIGADVGYLNLSLSSTMTVDMGVIIPGAQKMSDTKASSKTGFGYNANIGTMIYLSDSIYISAEAGYSAVSGGINGGIGVGLDFGGPKTGGSSQAAPVASSGNTKYEQYGDYYFRKAEYSKAMRYYAAANKQAKTAGLYAKIGKCYLKSGDKKKALSYLNYSLKMEDNDDVRVLAEEARGN